MGAASLRIVLGLALVAVLGSPAVAAPAPDPPRVRVELLADVQAVPAAGTFFTALVRTAGSPSERRCARAAIVFGERCQAESS